MLKHSRYLGKKRNTLTSCDKFETNCTHIKTRTSSLKSKFKKQTNKQKQNKTLKSKRL